MTGKAVFSRFMLVAAATALLTGCETMDAAMTSMDNTFAKIMPSFGKSADEGTTDVAAVESTAPEVTPTELAAISDPADCPHVGAVDDLNRINQFTTGAPMTAANQLTIGKITKIDSLCSIKDNEVTVDMDIHLASTLGAQGKIQATQNPEFAYPYFIAITTPKGDITAKEVFTAKVDFPANTAAEEHTEQMRQVIPLTGEFLPKDYEILVGFQLTPQELAFNRENPNGLPEPATQTATAAPAETPAAIATETVFEQPAQVAAEIPAATVDKAATAAASITPAAGDRIPAPEPAPAMPVAPTSGAQIAAPVGEPAVTTTNTDPMDEMMGGTFIPTESAPPAAQTPQ